jgi:hypothetical protein
MSKLYPKDDNAILEIDLKALSLNFKELKKNLTKILSVLRLLRQMPMVLGIKPL